MMFKVSRSQCRRMSAEQPIGNPERGYFDPMTAMVGTSAFVGGAGAIAGGNANASGIRQAMASEQDRITRIEPFRVAGTAALPQFQANINDQPTYENTLTNLTSDPGFQFELKQGTDAVQGSAAAGGMLRSGRTLKDLVKYAQGLAATRAGQAFDRSLTGFNNKQNQLLSLIQTGVNAAGAPSALPQLALAAGQGKADMYANLANTGTNALGNLAYLKMLQG